MIYLISGASRAGKTIIAKKLAKQKGISYFSIDWLIMGFTNGLPESGIHHMLFPHEIAEKSWRFLKAMIESMLWEEVDYIIEGEALLPELVIELLEKHPNQIEVCFVGFTNIDIDKKLRDIKQYRAKKKDWLSEKSDEYIKDHIQNMVEHSIKMKQSCEENSILYFDTSLNFIKVIENAIEYLSK
jgi:2-phosphoglycerate kinase